VRTSPPPSFPPAPPSPPARTVRSASKARKFAVGKLLGIGHIALFVVAIQMFLTHPRWGSGLLDWAHNLTIDWHAGLTGDTTASWYANGIVSGGYDWLRHLPWGLTENACFVLAIACLVMRLTRPMPGWLSLVVALPAAVYGLLRGIAEFPWLTWHWPLTAVTVVAAWIVVGTTVRRY
jgi:hypothetical protein